MKKKHAVQYMYIHFKDVYKENLQRGIILYIHIS